VYAALDPNGQKSARQLFLRLVTMDKGTEDMRRRVLRSELKALTEARPQTTDGPQGTFSSGLQPAVGQHWLNVQPAMQVARRWRAAVPSRFVFDFVDDW
jgi:hypothetical protein